MAPAHSIMPQRQSKEMDWASPACLPGVRYNRGSYRKEKRPEPIGGSVRAIVIKESSVLADARGLVLVADAAHDASPALRARPDELSANAPITSQSGGGSGLGRSCCEPTTT